MPIRQLRRDACIETVGPPGIVLAFLVMVGAPQDMAPAFVGQDT